MQKYDECELCGELALVADYGFNHEFICVECSLKDPLLRTHVTNEMVKRHGHAQIEEWSGMVKETRH